MIVKAIKGLFLCIMLSFFLFPISFAFFPESLNTKMILAVFGIFAFAYESVRNHSISISRYSMISAVIAVVFSVWCFYCITANGTDDTSYSRYWLSYVTWLGGAYGVCYIVKIINRRIDLESITFYLSLVCALQCILALLIDNIPILQQRIDSVVVQGQVYIRSVKRLYGIGASLDTAGVRFSVVLILIAHQMSSFGKAMENIGLSIFYLVSFALIVVVGSIIARTTCVGAIIGLFYMMVSFMRIQNGFVTSKQTVFWLLFSGITLASILVSIWLYYHNPDFRQSFRFGFEGFFNWFETGTFRTDSTDKLNMIMWVWPSDTRSWAIGTGLFENWIYGTDIGYCRFTLYCGLIGLVIFSFFFIYNGLSLPHLFSSSIFLAIILIALTFIIWMKVSTDIYFIYALLYSTANLQNTSFSPSRT